MVDYGYSVLMYLYLIRTCTINGTSQLQQSITLHDGL